MEDLQFELLENGLDFIASGLNHIVRGTTKADLKYNVLHLASGIELVLKERLRQEDWTLRRMMPLARSFAAGARQDEGWEGKRNNGRTSFQNWLPNIPSSLTLMRGLRLG